MRTSNGFFLGIAVVMFLFASTAEAAVAAPPPMWGAVPAPRSFASNHTFYELSMSGITDFCSETQLCETPQTKSEMTRLRNDRFRSWLVGILGVAAGAGVMLYGSQRMSDRSDSGLYLTLGGAWAMAGGVMYMYWSHPGQRDYMRFVNAYNREHPDAGLQIR